MRGETTSAISDGKIPTLEPSKKAQRVADRSTRCMRIGRSPMHAETQSAIGDGKTMKLESSEKTQREKKSDGDTKGGRRYVSGGCNDRGSERTTEWGQSGATHLYEQNRGQIEQRSYQNTIRPELGLKSRK